MPEVINLHDINEMLKLLKGGYPVRQIRRSQYDPPEFDVPTEISVVLNEYVYQDAGCKPVFQEALTVLFSGNAEEVFLGALYFDYCLSKEKNKTARILQNIARILQNRLQFQAISIAFPSTHSAVISGKPHMRLRFWTAWPEAPLVRLSMALETMRRLVRSS